MNEAIKMQISAFVDGELPDSEADLLLAVESGCCAEARSGRLP
jgi:negative regulator of sigma E activity